MVQAEAVKAANALVRPKPAHPISRFVMLKWSS